MDFPDNFLGLLWVDSGC